MTQPVIHLMHHGTYQRLNQWPGVQRYVLSNDENFHIWIRLDKGATTESFDALKADFGERMRYLTPKALP